MCGVCGKETIMSDFNSSGDEKRQEQMYNNNNNLLRNRK